MISYRTLKNIALGILTAAICCLAGLALLIQNPSVQRYGITRVSREMGCVIDTGPIRLHPGRRFGIQMQNVRVATPQGKALFSASELILAPAVSGLFLNFGTLFPGTIEAVHLKFQVSESGATRDYDLPRVVFNGKYDRLQRNLQIDSLKISAPETRLSAQGHIRFNPASSAVLDLSVHSPFMPVGTLESLLPEPLLPEWIGKSLLPAIRTGEIRVDDFSLKGNPGEIGALNQPDHAGVLGLNLAFRNAVLHPPGKGIPEFQDVSCRLSLQKGVLTVSGITGRFGNSTVQSSSVVIPNIYADKPRYQIDTAAGIRLTDLEPLKTLPGIPPDIQKELETARITDGTADIQVSAAYESGGMFPEIEAGHLSVDSLHLTQPRLILPLTVASAILQSVADQPFQFSGNGLWGQSAFQLQGAIDRSWKHWNAHAAVRADMGELIRTALPNKTFGEWIYGPLVAEGRLDERQAAITSGRIETGKGFIRLKGRQYYHSEAGMNWIGHIHIVGEPARNLYQVIEPGSRLIDGSTRIEGLLTLKNADATGRFSGLNGRASILIENGWIHQTNPILDALAMVSLERIFKPGSPGLQDGRLNFERMAADIQIVKGTVLVENLIVKSPAVNAAGGGTIDLNRNRLHLKIGLQPLGTVDSLVSSIPVIGRVLTGKDKSLIVYSLEITGSISDPKVTGVPIQKIGQSTLEYVERMVMNPETILKSLTDLKNRPPSAVPDYSKEFDRTEPAP